MPMLITLRLSEYELLTTKSRPRPAMGYEHRGGWPSVSSLEFSGSVWGGRAAVLLFF